MGLSFGIKRVEHLGFGWSYHGFNEFRHRIARSVWFKDAYSGTDTDIYMTGRFNEIENTHPLWALMSHEDCDGFIWSDDCGKIASYLKLVIDEWRKDDPDAMYDIENGTRLVEAMMKCYKEGVDLLFM
jgi:hypothetical protein